MMNWWDEQPPFDRWAIGFGTIGVMFSLAGLGFDSDSHITLGLMILFAVGMVAGYRQVLKEESAQADEEKDGGVSEPKVGE